MGLVSYQVISVLVLYILFILFFNLTVLWAKQAELFTMGLVLLVYVPKMVLTLVLLGEYI
jgi:hypothetical protein